MASQRRWLQIRDFWTLKPKEVLENKKHLFECRDSKSETGSSLLVHVEATHSGMVNGNRKFYRPDFMADSVHTWLPENSYARPVLIGHNEEGQVLGRVREAKYVDESWKWSTDFPTIKDSIFYNRDSKARVSLFKSVDWIVKNLQPLKDYKGLGYIDLGLQVTNPEAIRKVLADEYLTVSVGSATDEAICSICHQDWASNDKCEHKPGGMYDKQRMFLICGRFKYQEVSFVNFPADPFAIVKEKELKDSLEKMFFLGLPIGDQDTKVDSGLVLTDSLYESDIQLSVEDTMQKPDVAAIRAALESAELTAEQAFTFKDAVSAWKPEAKDEKVEKNSLTSTIAARIKKNEWVRDAAPATTAEGSEASTELSDAEVQAALVENEDAKKAKKEAKKDEEKPKCCDCGCEDSEENPLLVGDAEAICCTTCVAKVQDGKKGFESAKPLAANVPMKGTGKGQGKVQSNTPEEKPCEAPQERKGGKKKKKCAACTKDFETEVEDAERCEECNMTDSVKYVVEQMLKDEQAKEAATAGSEVVAIIKSLDASYTKIKDTNRWNVRWAVRCLIDHWSADDELKYQLAYLAKMQDSVVLSNDDLRLKDEMVTELTEAKDEFDSRKKALEQTAATAILDSKKALASQIVMFKVLKGADGFKALNPEQIQSKVDELAKRSLLSLKDTVSDILSELEWVKPQPAANQDNKAKEPEVKVNDNAQVDESESANPPADTRDLKVQDAVAFNRALSYIKDPAERARFEADVRYGRLKF